MKSLLKTLSSLKITVVCFVLLCVLLIAGTVYQTAHGIYEAQEKYFNSFVCFIGDLVPFPGTQLVMWLLAINLLAFLILRFEYLLKKPNINLLHLAVFALLISGFLTMASSVESYVTLAEGEKTNISHQYEETVAEGEKGAKYKLPFAIELLDFDYEMHPDTQIAKSYTSQVLLDAGGKARKLIISMNKPLRYKEYNVYQASYFIDSDGLEHSTFAVVKNPYRYLPYIFSLLISLTLFVFLIQDFLRGQDHAKA